MKLLDQKTDLLDAKDEIVEEVRRVRSEYAARFEYDLNRIFADLEQKAAIYPERYADLAPVRPLPSTAS
jgi:hypothetical protein